MSKESVNKHDKQQENQENHKHQNGNNEKQEKEIDVRSYYYPEISKINLREVSTGYSFLNDPRLLLLVCSSLLALFLTQFWVSDLTETWESFLKALSEQPGNKTWLKLLVWTCAFLTFLLTVTYYFYLKAKPIYLMDFSTYFGTPDLEVNTECFLELQRKGGFPPEAIAFQERLLHRTGLGEQTYFPPGIHKFDFSINAARQEAETVIFTCIDSLLARTGVKPHEIGIIVVNCSLFNPTPSLAEMIINKYKLGYRTHAVNISGMGCAAGVVALSVASDLLQVHHNTLALVVSTENITQNWYLGKEKSMLLQNTLFRTGGAAMLLSNKWMDRWRANYELKNLVKVHKGANDVAFKSVYQQEDSEGKKGVAITKELMSVVGDALKTNLSILGPQVLPFTEQAKFFIDVVRRKYLGIKGSGAYIPDFKKSFQHFCIHAGGRAIIDGLQQNLNLSEKHVEPSRATLYRVGNTSSSSIWYELRYIEGIGDMKKGDLVLQLAFGSGFQCNSAVWKCLRTVRI